MLGFALFPLDSLAGALRLRFTGGASASESELDDDSFPFFPFCFSFATEFLVPRLDRVGCLGLIIGSSSSELDEASDALDAPFFPFVLEICLVPRLGRPDLRGVDLVSLLAELFLDRDERLDSTIESLSLLAPVS